MIRKFGHSSSSGRNPWPAIAAGFLLSAGSIRAYCQSYTVVKDVSLPYASTDATAAQTPVTYSSLSITSLPNRTMPNTYGTPLVGLLTGKDTKTGATNFNTAFEFTSAGITLIGYYTETSNGNHNNSQVFGENSAGAVIGASPRSVSDSTNYNALGTDTWLYNPADGSNITLGLTTPSASPTTPNNFSYTASYTNVSGTTSTGMSLSANANYINTAGQVAGTNSRYAGDSVVAGGGTASISMGTSAWLYTPANSTAGTAAVTTEIGLTGTGYSYNYKSKTAAQGGANGQTIGKFYANSIAALTGSTSTAAGSVIGISNAYNDQGDGTGVALGQDAFIYDSSSSTPTSVPFSLYLSGLKPTTSNFGSTDFEYFKYSTASNNSTTPSLYEYRYTQISSVNASGVSAGYTNIYDATTGNLAGQGAFTYNPAVSGAAAYTIVGLTANGFTPSGTTNAPTAAGQYSYESTTGSVTNSARFINDTGTTAGTATNYISYVNSSGTLTTSSGTAAWVATPSGATNRIGLYNVASSTATSHVNQYGVESNSPSILTESGFIAGTATRYLITSSTTATTIGTDVWVYDPAKQQTLTLDFNNQGNEQYGGFYSAAAIYYLSEQGVAVGQFKLSSTTSSSGAGAYQGFIWTQSTGVITLNNAVSSTLGSTGYQNFITTYFSDLNGNNLYATASTNGTSVTTQGTVTDLVALTGTVPEPTAGLLVELFLFSRFGRRNRRRVSA